VATTLAATRLARLRSPRPPSTQPARCSRRCYPCERKRTRRT
jgi:hypothetical protein